MPTPIVMPQLGLTMTEGAVSVWLKQPGDAVKKGEPVFAVTTDKAEMEVESMVEGTLQEIVVEPGRTVPVGTVIAYVTGAQDSGTPAREPRSPVSPRARRLAGELGVELANVQGSGPGGRVCAADVLAAASPKPAAPPTPAAPPDAQARRRKIIADRMTESVATVPTFSVELEANAERLVELYDDLSSGGQKVTYTDLLLKAMAVALAKSPEMNARWQGDAAVRQSAIDLGLAVATEQGVTAPVLRDIGALGLAELAKRRAAIVDQARRNALALGDLEGGAGTLSNLGMYRVDRFHALINPGQAFILATGQLRKRPWVAETVTVKPTIVLNLSVDHRIADGAAGAAFLERIAGVIEKPYQVLWQAQ